MSPVDKSKMEEDRQIGEFFFSICFFCHLLFYTVLTRISCSHPALSTILFLINIIPHRRSAHSAPNEMPILEEKPPSTGAAVAQRPREVLGILGRPREYWKGRGNAVTWYAETAERCSTASPIYLPYPSRVLTTCSYRIVNCIHEGDDPEAMMASWTMCVRANPQSRQETKGLPSSGRRLCRSPGNVSA